MKFLFYIEQNVRWFEGPMNNLVLMKLLDSSSDLQGHQKDVSLTLERFHESVQIEG